MAGVALSSVSRFAAVIHSMVNACCDWLIKLPFIPQVLLTFAVVIPICVLVARLLVTVLCRVTGYSFRPDGNLEIRNAAGVTTRGTSVKHYNVVRLILILIALCVGIAFIMN